MRIPICIYIARGELLQRVLLIRARRERRDICERASSSRGIGLRDAFEQEGVRGREREGKFLKSLIQLGGQSSVNAE